MPNRRCAKATRAARPPREALRTESTVLLATGSRTRIQAFSFLQVPFLAVPSGVDEKSLMRPARAPDLVKFLARAKARALSKQYAGHVVLGFDSVGLLDGVVLEKPATRAGAWTRLRSLSGRQIVYYTGIHVVYPGTKGEWSDVVRNDIAFRMLTEMEIETYLNSEAGYADFALGFNPLHGLSSSFVRKVTGSPSNYFWGIPLEMISQILTMAPELG